MKVKLLIKLRNIGRGMINIISVTKENGLTTGMSYGYDYDEYKGLFDIGDTKECVKEKAARIYIKNNINEIRKKYKPVEFDTFKIKKTCQEKNYLKEKN